MADRTTGDFVVDEFSQESSWLRAPCPPHLEFDGHLAITRCVPCDGPLPETGTLLTLPDDWSAQQVVDATQKTLELNGLDELPH